MAKNTPIQHVCSFCKRLVTIRDQYDMPILDAQSGFAICKNCIGDIYHFIEDHDAHKATANKKNFAASLGATLKKNKPHIIKEYLDQYIIE